MEENLDLHVEASNQQAVIFMEAIPLCLLLNKLYLLSRAPHRFILIQIVPLHVWYMFWHVFRPSLGMSTQKFYKGR